ncbi:hypothetical protein [Gloeothece verrucosa]|uniref:hypothetical protein n=1 Tax=Gloeothece verrucosa TaxID=2546359 RepID=UPI0002F4B8A0|nr:hypothetical protein [Gloeothece verrucosa]
MVGVLPALSFGVIPFDVLGVLFVFPFGVLPALLSAVRPVSPFAVSCFFLFVFDEVALP